MTQDEYYAEIAISVRARFPLEDVPLALVARMDTLRFTSRPISKYGAVGQAVYDELNRRDQQRYADDGLTGQYPMGAD